MRKPIPTIAETKLLEPFNYLAQENIIVPVSAGDFEAARVQIKAAGVVGFDTESKPVLVKGAVNDGPHIVQFSTENKAFIFQLGNPESHNPLLYLLAAEDIKKIGFDLASDRKLLLKKFGVLPRGFVDLCPAFKKQGYRNTVGLRAAIAIVFNRQFHKSKHATMSNWSHATLSESQLMYAANDAYAALCVYLKLSNETDA
jgi:ribonuclease D